MLIGPKVSRKSVCLRVRYIWNFSSRWQSQLPSPLLYPRPEHRREQGYLPRDVPHQMTTRTPRNHCQSVRSSSVCACWTWRFFDRWDACLGKRAVYDVVDGAVSRDSAETERAGQSVAASGIYSGSTSTHVWLTYCDSKAQADRHSNVLVFQS